MSDPMAFVHPTRVLDAFDCDAVWVEGNAMIVKSDSDCPIDMVHIVQDGYVTAYRLPMKTPPETIPATVQHKCARCEQVLDLTRETNLDDAIDNHEEHCIRPGDHVRWEFPLRSLWVEGKYIDSTDKGFWTEHRLTVAAASGGWDTDEDADEDDGDDTQPPVAGTVRSFGTDNHSGTTIRRIPRPEPKVERHAFVHGESDQLSVVPIDHNLTPHATDAQIKALLEAQGGVVGWSEEQPTLSARLGHLKHGPGGSGLSGPCDADCRKCSVEREALYDGLTARECWHRWSENAHRIECPLAGPLLEMTPAQIAAAKVENMDAMKAWSQRLRAKISASKQAERNRVAVDLQDDE